MATYDQYGYDNSRAQQATSDAPEQEDALPGKALNASQKKAIAAALVGTAALGGAAYGLSRLEDSDGSDQLAASGAATDTSPTPAPPVATAIPASFDESNNVSVLSGEPRMATAVTDDMTFDEAFAAARAEMGPGDYFTWHGNYYNTYFKDEWEGMSETEHLAFKDSLGDLIDTDSPALAQNELAEPAHHAVVAHHESTHHAAAHHAAPAVAAVVKPADQANVSVIDDIAGANSNVTVMHVDGHAVSLIDTNNDKQTDMTLADNNVVLLDTDKDQKLDAQGVYDASTHHVEHVLALDAPISAPPMDADDRQLPSDYEQLYSNHSLTAGQDNLAHGGQADTFDLGN